MGREHRIQKQLAPVFPYVAAMVAFCDDADVVGSEFYVMERLEGLIPRADLPEDALTPEQARGLCLSMVDVLAELHAVDPDAAGLTSLGKGAGYVRRQVEGWSVRYRNARTDDAPDGEAVMAWLAAHQPADVGNCLIHNDFRFDNIVLDAEDPTRPIGVLDWEMATVGDPLMDLGGTLSYWVQQDDDEFFLQFRRQPTTLPGMLSRDEVVAYYCDAMGYSLTPDQWRFYEVFGLFRLAVIAQQIYYRYFHKQTTNESYAIFGPAVQYLESRCRSILGIPALSGPSSCGEPTAWAHNDPVLPADAHRRRWGSCVGLRRLRCARVSTVFGRSTDSCGVRCAAWSAYWASWRECCLRPFR